LENLEDPRLALAKWYTDVSGEIDLTLEDESAYGVPDPEFTAVIERRLEVEKASAVDIAGGDGRNALWVAEQGHNIHIVDLDPAHLAAAQRKAAKLPNGAGTVTTGVVDLLKDEDALKLGSRFDLSINDAFLYLPPPSEAKAIFRRYSVCHRAGGLAVVNFYTNRIRETLDGEGRYGEEEYLYTEQEGYDVLEQMYDGAGFGDLEIDTYEIHELDSYRLDATVLVASGIRKGLAV
jgi:hypothetical protein